MKGYEYKDGMTTEEQAKGAYWERNMLALFWADGYYYDTDNNWDGWHRVLSLLCGKMCFHIPDDFDIGNLEEIKPNWDGHSTKEKWDRVAKGMAMTLEWDEQ